MKLIRTRKANGDLLRIYRYLSDHDRRAAEAMARRIDRVFRQIAEHPLAGVSRAELGEGHRSRLAGHYVVIYRSNSHSVTILRVIDGRMDIEAEFDR